MCEEAERLACHSVWLSEHHLFDDGYLPQPLTMAAAIAARTKTMRIGTAILIAPLHHPAEVAEQAAIVDLVSNGRVEIGIGAGYRVPEFELFGANLAERYEATDHCALELRRLWERVTPRPVQHRVPIWMVTKAQKERVVLDCSAKASSAAMLVCGPRTATRSSKPATIHSPSAEWPEELAPG